MSISAGRVVRIDESFCFCFYTHHTHTLPPIISVTVQFGSSSTVTGAAAAVRDVKTCVLSREVVQGKAFSLQNWRYKDTHTPTSVGGGCGPEKENKNIPARTGKVRVDDGDAIVLEHCCVEKDPEVEKQAKLPNNFCTTTSYKLASWPDLVKRNLLTKTITQILVICHTFPPQGEWKLIKYLLSLYQLQLFAVCFWYSNSELLPSRWWKANYHHLHHHQNTTARASDGSEMESIGMLLTYGRENRRKCFSVFFVVGQENWKKKSTRTRIMPRMVHKPQAGTSEKLESWASPNFVTVEISRFNLNAMF